MFLWLDPPLSSRSPCMPNILPLCSLASDGDRFVDYCNLCVQSEKRLIIACPVARQDAITVSSGVSFVQRKEMVFGECTCPTGNVYFVMHVHAWYSCVWTLHAFGPNPVERASLQTWGRRVHNRDSLSMVFGLGMGGDWWCLLWGVLVHNDILVFPRLYREKKMRAILDLAIEAEISNIVSDLDPMTSLFSLLFGIPVNCMLFQSVQCHINGNWCP